MQQINLERNSVASSSNYSTYHHQFSHGVSTSHQAAQQQPSNQHQQRQRRRAESTRRCRLVHNSSNGDSSLIYPQRSWKSMCSHLSF